VNMKPGEGCMVMSTNTADTMPLKISYSNSSFYEYGFYLSF
jgi:hypothetical protein